MSVQRRIRRVRALLPATALAILLLPGCGQAEGSAAPSELDLVETVGCLAQNETGIPYTTFHIEGGDASIAVVNEDGVMAGHVGDNTGSWASFVLGQDRNLDVFTLHGHVAHVADINEHGDVAGSGSVGPDSSIGFVRSRDGATREFPLVPSGRIRSISDDGLVAGYREVGYEFAGFTNSIETGTTLYEIDWTWDVRLEVVNDNGWSAGTAHGPEGRGYGFVVDPSGLSTIFEVDDVRSATIVDMNVHGDVTGYHTGEAPSIRRGFVRYVSGEIVTFDVSGADTVPSAINDKGEVVGTHAALNGSDDFNPRSGFFRSTAGSMTTVTIPGAHHTNIRDLTNSAIAVGNIVPPGLRSSSVGLAIDFRSSCVP